MVLSYDESNVIRLTWSGNQVEDNKTHNYLECYQYADHARVFNIIWSVSGIINTLLGVSVFQKVHIQPAIESESTDGEIRCMYKAVKKKMFIRRYMVALVLNTGAPTLHW